MEQQGRKPCATMKNYEERKKRRLRDGFPWILALVPAKTSLPSMKGSKLQVPTLSEFTGGSSDLVYG